MATCCLQQTPQTSALEKQNPNKSNIVLMSSYMVRLCPSANQRDPKVTEASQQSEMVSGKFWKSLHNVTLSHLKAKASLVVLYE